MVTTECSQEASRVRVVIEPNQSLTWRESLIFFAAAAVLSLAVALAFAMQGYWPILPFAGLELLALGWAVYQVAQYGRRRQVITITADRIRIEKGRSHGRSNTGGGPESCREFPRAWARVELVKPRKGWYPSRLMIGASGKAVPVGEFLTDEEREELKTRLELALVDADGTGFAAPDKEFK